MRSLAVAVIFPTCLMSTVLMGTILGVIAYHEYPKSSKKLEEDKKHCERLLSRQTESMCEKRLEYCCKSGKINISKPVCATTINGFGAILYNKCSLYYIRCMYPDVCFLKRAPSHPHCSQVMTQDVPLDIPCDQPKSRADITTKPTTLMNLTTMLSSTASPTPTKEKQRISQPIALPEMSYQGDENVHMTTRTTETSSSTLSKTVTKTLPKSTTGRTYSTIKQYLPRTSSSSQAYSTAASTLNRTQVPTRGSELSESTIPSIKLKWSTVQEITRNSIEVTESGGHLTNNSTVYESSTTSIPDIRSTINNQGVTPPPNNSVSRDDVLFRTSATFARPPECGESLKDNFPVFVDDAVLIMNNGGYTSGSSFQFNCTLPPPVFPLCTFPTDGE